MAEDGFVTSRGGSPQPREGAPRSQIFLEMLAVLLGAFVGWLYALGMTWTASVLILLAIPMLLGRVGRVDAKIRVLLGTVVLLTAVLGWRRSIRELQSNLDRLQELKDRSDSGRFGLRDNLAVYGLNLAMGIGGTVAGLPEVSEETLLLCVRDGPVRTWRSDFAMRSPRVRTEVRRLSELAQGGGVSASKAALPTTRITWTRYDPADDSFRVALALNSPLELTGSVRPDHDGAWLDLIARARIEYPRRAVLRLFSFEGRPVSLDEGLFWVLQQDGWLHPYTAEWRWSVRSDDPRLNDTRPVRSWREQLLAWLFRDGHSPERVR